MNPGDLAAWRAALDGISNALAIAGTILALAAFAFPVLFVPGRDCLRARVGFAAAAMAVDVERVRRGELDESELIWDAVGVFGSAIPGGKMGTKGLKALRGYRATQSKGWKTRYRRYGPSGRKPTTGSKVEDLAWETGGWVAKISEELDERLNEPHPLTGICGPAARGPAVSPLALIRHARPITVKPASFAGATP